MQVMKVSGVMQVIKLAYPGGEGVVHPELL